MKNPSVQELHKQIDSINDHLAEQLDFYCRACNYAYQHGNPKAGRHYGNRAQHLRAVLVDNGILQK